MVHGNGTVKSQTCIIKDLKGGTLIKKREGGGGVILMNPLERNTGYQDRNEEKKEGPTPVSWLTTDIRMLTGGKGKKVIPGRQQEKTRRSMTG